ncbi:MAG: hypothetical protein P8Y54_05875 [Xanthomonadales bacterium]
MNFSAAERMHTADFRHKPIELLRFTGLLAWVCATVPLLMMYSWYDPPLSTDQYLGWWILHLVFGFAYWNQVRELPVRTSLWHRVLTVMILTVSALGVSLMAQTAVGGILLLIVGGMCSPSCPASSPCARTRRATNCARSIRNCAPRRPCWPTTHALRSACASRANCTTWSATT